MKLRLTAHSGHHLRHELMSSVHLEVAVARLISDVGRLWQLATDEDGACRACGTPLQLCGHRSDTDAKALREAADRIQAMAPGWARRMREEAERTARR